MGASKDVVGLKGTLFYKTINKTSMLCRQVCSVRCDYSDTLQWNESLRNFPFLSHCHIIISPFFPIIGQQSRQLLLNTYRVYPFPDNKQIQASEVQAFSNAVNENINEKVKHRLSTNQDKVIPT